MTLSFPLRGKHLINSLHHRRPEAFPDFQKGSGCGEHLLLNRLCILLLPEIFSPRTKDFWTFSKLRHWSFRIRSFIDFADMPGTQDDSTEVDFGDNVDMATFEQILDMDEEPGDREFSQGIVFDFFSQAEQTFEAMDDDVKKKNLASLSDKGHFLKGSSATLGFTKIKDECEKIQHWGKKKDETGTLDEPDEAKLLRLIADSLLEAKKAYKVVEALMKKYYGEA